MLAEMAALCMDVYLYAPKEEPYHRFDWRTPYPSDWQRDFSAFAAQAQGHNITLAAGIAPGLDYSWHDPPELSGCFQTKQGRHQLEAGAAQASPIASQAKA